VKETEASCKSAAQLVRRFLPNRKAPCDDEFDEDDDDEEDEEDDDKVDDDEAKVEEFDNEEISLLEFECWI